MADEYRSKFEPYQEFYAENEALDIEQLLNEDHDADFFRKWLGRYRLEHIQCKNCPVEKDLGLLLVSTETLRSELLPSPLKCLDVSFLVDNNSFAEKNAVCYVSFMH